MKTTINNICMLLMYTIIFCITAKASAQTCISGNCVNGQGAYTWPSGSKYIGGWQNSKPHGEGIQTFPNAATKQGIWAHGVYAETNPAWDAKETREIIAILEKTIREEPEKVVMPKFTPEEIDMYFKTEDELADMKRRAAIDEAFGANAAPLPTETNKEAIERREKEKRERTAKEAAEEKYDRIYTACLLDKSTNIDMQIGALRAAVHRTCESIADDPSWLENFKYN